MGLISIVSTGVSHKYKQTNKQKGQLDILIYTLCVILIYIFLIF